MPRSFLLTHRRYPIVQQYTDEEQDELDMDMEMAEMENNNKTIEEEEEEDDDDDDVLYNLTQLAEVSLAAGQLHTSKISDFNTSKPNESRNDHHYYECNECGKRYTTSSNLARHRQVHRSLTDAKARRCPHCDKLYVSVPAYSMHVRTHSQACRCHICGKCFSRPWLLQGHIRTHTGEKPFHCNICTKAFADKSNLRAHIQTHSTRKPYICSKCGKAFALKSYLYKHEEASCLRQSSSSPPPPPPPQSTSNSSASTKMQNAQQLNNLTFGRRLIHVTISV